MTRSLVSVVIETVTTRLDCANESLALSDGLARPLGGLDRQTYPQELIERIVVLDRAVAEAEADELCRRYPSVRFVSSLASNYFAAKNAGAVVATGDIIVMLDGDCEPVPVWLEALLSRLESGVAAVAGRTRYVGKSWRARTFSIANFQYVLAGEKGEATGLNSNNVAFRREVLLAYMFDARIRRDGGCYFLFHQLRADGARILYEPRAAVAHGLDFRGFDVVRKLFNRGYDGVAVYRLDERAVLGGTRLFRRLGAAALVPITCRRLVLDWLRMLRHHRQIGISIFALPYFMTIVVGVRLIELAGGVAAAVAPKASGQET